MSVSDQNTIAMLRAERDSLQCLTATQAETIERQAREIAAKDRTSEGLRALISIGDRES